MDSEKDLSFKPITDGLGFHPFSDGLPYAPKGTKPATKSSGRAAPLPPSAISRSAAAAGATAAGRPSFATSAPTPTPRISVPVARPTLSGYVPAVPQASRLAAALPASRPAALMPSRATSLAPGVAPATARESLMIEPSFGFGYLFKRVLAYTIDTVFNLALCAGALSLALLDQNLNPDVLFGPGVIMMACLFMGAFNWAIMTAQEVAFGTTLGKRMFGLGLQGSLSAIFLRAFFFLPGVFFCGLGLLWALVDRRRRCWHDLVVDLQPLEAPRS